VKGVANQSKKCAMCRQEIPTDYFEKPVLVAQSNTDKDSAEFDDGYQWFYEGRNGKCCYFKYGFLTLNRLSILHIYIFLFCTFLLCSLASACKSFSNHSFGMVT
jgi:hypothetical protein